MRGRIYVNIEEDTSVAVNARLETRLPVGFSINLHARVRRKTLRCVDDLMRPGRPKSSLSKCNI